MLALIAILGGWPTAPAPVRASPQVAGLPQPAHVVIVMEENHSYSEVIGAASAPYINSLATGGAVFNNSHGVEHPSQPNYLDLFSGANQGVTDDSCPHTFSTANLGDELITAGLSFSGYSEDLPAPGSLICQSGSYYRKHNPWSNFSQIPAGANLPFTSFPTDYSTLPTVAFVIPNQMHDMHDGTIAQADTWLQQNLDGYAQWARTHNSLLIVQWDEDDYSASNQIPTLFNGSMVVPGLYSEAINHYALLRTVEDMYGLPYAGASANATPITDVWVGATPTPVPTATATAIPSATATAMPSATATANPSATATANPSATATPPPCTAPFSDIAGNPFASYIANLYCQGIVEGYPDGTFRPYSDTDRGTLARWVVKARGWAIDTTGGPHFSDVPATDPLYPYVETAYNHGIISGYGDGTFRPTNPLTRGQMSKIIVNAMGWLVDTTGGPHFHEVDAANPFYGPIETIFNRGIVNGYTCGGMGEPCDPQNRPYFRWGANITRGQLSKVLSNAISAGPAQPGSNR